ncbi:MAG: GNAT family N-acetyltransferase [Pseudomonadota bacterium]
MIPTLTTDRLILRAPRAEDVPPFAAFYASDAARFVGGPMPDWKVWRYLAEVVGHWTFRGFGRWIVTRRDDDVAIGLVGLHHPPDWPEPEIGWMLWETGQGLGTEAAYAARRWGYGPGGLPTLISSIDAGNARFIALAERMGARPDGSFAHPQYGSLDIWRHPAPSEVAP